jgi:hypothetical protein
MTSDCPDDEDCGDRIQKCDKQTAIIGGRSPKWCWRFQSKEVREQRQVCHSAVAEKGVDYLVEESSEPIHVKPGRQAARSEARTQHVV